MTGMPPPGHAMAHDTPSGTGAVLVRANQADGYLGAAMLSQPDGAGQARAAATNERRNRR
jgi:hypothetical protein